ncbi:WD40-repeat-containing domain protein [Jimgerdemannia flammicorona]|uniref:Elongator complex protein 2 n=1 Tax=Jimgerdemannia flammicorona TaxID=994334 RepID=A0A433QH07_9FUNG|nr:WD40-repeat-containing domain protein [Jimgerdemannia flammicorona]
MVLTAKATAEFISVGCNRITQAAAWGIDGLVAFGTHHAVALYYPQDPQCRGIVATLPGHTGRVNCVEFINRGNELDQTNVAIVSGSADKTVKIWKLAKGRKWVNSATLTGHTGGIDAIGCMRAPSIAGEPDLLATGSGDGTIRVWERRVVDDETDEVTCVQVIQCGVKYPLSLAISYLPGSNVPILASGTTDKHITIYISQRDPSSSPSVAQFVRSLALQGHDNWVRSLAFATYTPPPRGTYHAPSPNPHHTMREGDLLLASASQDKYIRLWRVAVQGGTAEEGRKKAEASGGFTKDMLEALEESVLLGESVQLSTKAHVVDVDIASENESQKKQRYNIMFEALLMGHDDWVFSVGWQKPMLVQGQDGVKRYHQPMALVSASSDKSMMIWRPDTETGVWLNQVRVGEIGGTLGFYGGLFGPDGRFILAHGYNGAFHLWKNIGTDEDGNDWQPQVTTSGHFKDVQSLSWDPMHQYLVSVSLDQTARLFAPWEHTATDGRPATTWHEIGRPQIHGYDIQCIAFVNRWEYVSGADEKVIRVFDAPKTFVENLSNISGLSDLVGEGEKRPLGANLPALGLSNKAVFEGEAESMANSEVDYLRGQSYAPAPSLLADHLTHPPFEEYLLQHSLWPEVEKLYGHGYEIISVGASHDGKLVASACKAALPEHAIIRLFETSKWKELPNPLASHSLTVTQTKFSHDDRFLLSVSRDRLWSLFERVLGDDANPYKLVAQNKSHARIIWDCSWSHDGKLFATGSRDKTVKIWSQTGETSSAWSCLATIKLSEAVTAVDLAPFLIHGGQVIYMILFGMACKIACIE